MIDKSTAIISLVPTASFKIEYPSQEVTWIDPVEPPVTEAEIQAEVARLQAEYDAKDYQRKRAAEYPSTADQFDLLYHGGYDAWKAAIDAVKTKYPKA